MPLFGKSSKNPVEVVKSLKEAVNALEKVDKKAEKVSEPVTQAVLKFSFRWFAVQVGFSALYGVYRFLPFFFARRM